MIWRCCLFWLECWQFTAVFSFYLTCLKFIIQQIQLSKKQIMDVSLYFINLNIVRLNTGSKLFFFFVILFSNIVFLLYWAFKMYEEIKNTMRTSLKQIYLYVCLCGNKKRLEEEIKKRVIQDENDIMKEEFDRRNALFLLFIELDEIKKLWNPNPRYVLSVHHISEGKLVLNRINIEKSGVYLHPSNFLKNIMGRRQPTEDELRSKNYKITK